MSHPESATDPTRRRLFHILGLAVGASIAATLFFPVPIWVLPAVIFPTHLVLLWAQLAPSSQWLGPVMTRFRPRDGAREVWLTIDDGPDPLETPAVLDALDRFGARATFFLIGKKATAHPEVVREIHRRGHQVANHSATHPQAWFWTLPRARVAGEIDGGSAALRTALGDEAAGAVPPWFRAPVGMKPLSLHPLLAARRWALVGWSVRGRDGVRRAPLDKVVERLMRGAKPGAILVLHEARGHAPALLERLLPRLQDAGLACVIPDGETLSA